MLDFIHKVLTWLLKLFHINISEQKQASLEQFIRFCIVGLSNTVLSYVIYVVVVAIMEHCNLLPDYNYFVGNVISWVLSVAWSFYWNNRFVFNEEKRSGVDIWKALLKCYMSYALSGLVLTNILSWIWIDKLGISRYIAPIINLLVSVPLNFIMNKFWAFRKKA